MDSNRRELVGAAWCRPSVHCKSRHTDTRTHKLLPNLTQALQRHVSQVGAEPAAKLSLRYNRVGGKSPFQCDVRSTHGLSKTHAQFGAKSEHDRPLM